MVPDTTPRAGAEHPQWRRDGAGNGSAYLVEPVGVVDAIRGSDYDAHATGRHRARDRINAPLRARILRRRHGPKLYVHVLWFSGRVAGGDRLCDLDRAAG